MNIYDRINLLLTQKGKTRKDLCNATGISYNTLTSLFQRQSQNMKLETIHLISSYLNVSVEYLINGNERPPYLINEPDQQVNNNASAGIDSEILRILKKLGTKNKTILLAKAYELEEKENDSKN